jgi:phosphoglycolate phosphatase/AHBA synthesis associated protein
VSRVVRAVLFDLDGVLVDSYEAWFQVLCAVAERGGYPPVTREDFAAGWGQGISADVERFFPDLDVAELERRYEAEYARQLAHLRFDPHARAVLAELRARGLPTALVTNTPSPMARAVLAQGGLALDHVVGGTDVPRGKPAPDMVLRACALVGVAPAGSLLVGDTDYDRLAAEAAGAPFVGLRFGAGRRIERLDELFGVLARAA